MSFRFVRPALQAGLFILLLASAGCWKKSGDGIVIAKDYVPALPISTSPTPNESSLGAETPSPIPVPDEETAEAESTEPVPGEMDSPIPGEALAETHTDARAVDHEQWIATVRMVADGRLVDVRLTQERWDKLKTGDRVQVKYREGKYTGTVWSSEID
ncbi:MAG: hypothetical protein ACR2HH_06955 [Chthoniobacterales bacterium]